MKNIDEYIIEQEFNEHFLIEEGFLEWITKLGKKFWNWLTDKNYKSDDLDWSLYNDNGKRLKTKWVDVNNDHLTSMFNGKNGLEEQFVNIMKTLKKYNKFIKHIQGINAINKNKIPPIVILYTTNKNFIYTLLKSLYKKVYDKYENRIRNIQDPVMILSIEIARDNDNSVERIWDDYIYSEITHAFLDSYDIVFFDVNNISKLKKYLKDEWGTSNSFPITDGKEHWEDISDETEDEEDNSDEENAEIKESLDIDNLFWMLDTWFTNNEQERSTFMSIIDNCIIKRTYNKNDLAKICDNINFDIRPFINFICKDTVVKDNEQEDFNIDYYYELKKVIDTLISNKATNNKFVRFS